MAPSPLNLLRIARACDHLEIAALWRVAWASANPHAPSLAPLEHWLERAHQEFTASHEVWIREVNGAACAFHVLHPPTQWLDQLHVHPEHHGQGLGQAALNQVCARFPDGWSLHVATDNRRAIRLYERFGMQAGDISQNPSSGRTRIEYRWSPTAPSRTGSGPGQPDGL